jgi:hypothetical protein
MKRGLLAAIIIFFVGQATIPILGLLIAKHKFTQNADEQSVEILKHVEGNSQTQIAHDATKLLYFRFSKEGYKADPGIARLRPFLSNSKMPDIFRTPSGALELSTFEGWCDDAARALIYVLAKEGIRAEQWNMQGPHTAHAAVHAYFNDGTSALLDPFYGYTSIVNGKPHDPISIRDAMRNGKSSSGLLKPFDKRSNKEFYKEFGTYFMGDQGGPLTITAQIPVSENTIELGKIDGDYVDARRELTRNDMTITWEYVGHKYDRGWTREMVANQPVQVQIILTRKPKNGILRTFTPAPTVDGTKLTWNLLKGEKIISEDGNAAISWTRLKSYIDVDQIVITPKGATP